MNGRAALLLLVVIMVAAPVRAARMSINVAPGGPAPCGVYAICESVGDVLNDYPPAALTGGLLPIHLGLQAGDVINSLSWASDSLSGGASIYFSVGPTTVGATGAVAVQAAAGEASADIFDGGTLAAPASSTLAVDGDGLPGAAAPALGLSEPSGGGSGPFSDLTVLASCGPNYDLSVLTLANGSPSLALKSATPADILIATRGILGVYRPAADLGLVAGDVIDGLAFPLTFPLGDLRFSLAPGSPSLALHGFSAADILAPGPLLAVSASALGLLASDDIDALDIIDDPDHDLVAARCDNCPTIANNGQQNTDGGPDGDACDPCTDSDGDGFGNPGIPASTCPLDNCPTVSNPDQADGDGDGVGDLCDVCRIGDDGLDADADTVPDACDSCPGIDDRVPGGACAQLYGLGQTGLLHVYNPYSLRSLSSVPVTLAGATIVYFRGLAFDAVRARFYALLILDGQDGYELVTIDPITGVATSIGNTGDRFDMLTADCSGTLYAATLEEATISVADNSLFRLDPTTASATLLRGLSRGRFSGGLAFRATDRSLYHYGGDRPDEHFERLDVSSLTLADVPLSSGAGTVHSLVYWPQLDVFLGAAGLSNQSLQMTPAGGVSYAPAPEFYWQGFPYGLAFSGAPADCPPRCPAAPASGCAVPQRSLLQLRDLGGDGGSPHDGLLWKWLRGPATNAGDFGDPTDDTDYALCVYSSAGLRLEASVPRGGTCGDKPCWQANRRGFRYVHPASNAAGISAVKLRDGAANRSQIVVKGRDAGLPLTPTTLPLASGDVTVQLQRSGSAACWSATFSAAAVRHNDDQLFKAVTP
jgi:hypothetical protein